MSAILERDAFDAGEPTHRLDVVVTSDPTRALITLHRVGREEPLGTRTLEGQGSCAAMLPSLSLVTAMLVDLSRRDAILHMPAEAPAEDHHAPFEFGLAVGAGAQLALGPTPQALGFVSVSFVPWPWLAVYTEVLMAPYADVPLDAVRIELTGVAGVLGICPRLAFEGGHALEACAEVGAGSVAGSGRNLDFETTALVPWVFAGGAIRARLMFASPWFLTLVARVGGTIVRPAFYYRDEAYITMYQASELDAVAGVLLGLRLFP